MRFDWLARWAPQLLSVLRIMTALLFLQHPFAKFFKIPHVAMFDNLQLFSLGGIAGRSSWSAGLCCCLGSSPGRWPLSWRVKWRSPISWDTRRAAFIR